MNIKNILTSKRTMIMILLLVITAAIALYYANKDQYHFFFTPDNIAAGQAPSNRDFDLGGIVVARSRITMADGLTNQFILASANHQIKVHFRGKFPKGFKSGSGSIARGYINKKGIFVAQKIRAAKLDFIQYGQRSN